MTCAAAIRPFSDLALEVRCEADHDDAIAEALGADLAHHGIVRDYAWPGSRTDVQWRDDDRRSHRGDWPGLCGITPGCTLPAGHPRLCNRA